MYVSTLDSLSIKSVVSLTKHDTLCTTGFRWMSTNFEIFAEWQLIELITGLPGLSFL